MQWLTIQKGLYCAMRPELWSHLRLRVAPAIEHIAALSQFSFSTVVDVGANRGQFATIARRLFPDARIYSFEPLPGPATIFSKALGGDARVSLFNNAIGPEAKSATIYVTTRDDSSSLLQPAAAQDDIFGVTTARTDQIRVRRLSDCLGEAELRGPALLKIDVQGGERDVLDGSSNLIDRFDAIYVECSFVEMYEKQPLYRDIARWMDAHQFQLAGVYNQHVDPRHGPVQADFLFVKAKPSVMAAAAS